MWSSYHKSKNKSLCRGRGFLHPYPPYPWHGLNKDVVGMKELEKLQEFERVRGKLKLPRDIKPCIVELLKNSNNWRNDKRKVFIVGCELYRVGQTEKQIGAILTMDLGVKESKVRNILKGVEKGKYEFGCATLELEGLCNYDHRKDCFWWQAIPKRSKKSYNERDFWRYGWTEELSSAESIMYLAVREIEKRRNYQAGARLFVNRKQMAKTSGLSGKWAIRCCEKLAKVGLIKFKVGVRHLHYGKASEVKRVLPIPKPKKG